MTDRARAALALTLLVPVPSLGIAAVVAWPGAVGNAVFVGAKAWVLLLPLAWLVFVEKRRPAVPRPSARGLGPACASGAAIFLAIVLAYVLLGEGWIEPARLRERMEKAHLATPAAFLAGALYWCTLNSLAEEYVWRWFTFSRSELLFTRVPAVAVSALFFTLHHVVALQANFGDLRVTILASLGVFSGGVVWSWLYARYRNIWAAYVSHVFADLAVFGIGYVILFGDLW